MLRFWDSSPLMPLCLEDPHSGRLRALATEDPHIVAWWGTVVECTSAMARLGRDGFLNTEEERQVAMVLDTMVEERTEIRPSEELRRSSIQLLRHHPLRAADALQLAAAHLWTAGRPEGNTIICIDRRLRDAALLEGFVVLP